MPRVLRDFLRRTLALALILTLFGTSLTVFAFGDFNYSDFIIPPSQLIPGHFFDQVGDNMPPDINFETRFGEPPILRWRSNGMISERTLTRRLEGMDIREPIPVVNPAFGPASEIINFHIEEAVASLISEARRVRARAITFRYEIHATNELVSIVIYATVSSVISRTFVRSVNFSPFDGNLLTMNDAMGIDVASLTERILVELIRSDPGHYYAALSAPLTNQAFFLTDNELVLLFDEFRLSTREEGVHVISLIRNYIRTATITRGEYQFSPDGYNLKMIPVRNILEEFGFFVDWDPWIGVVRVWRGPELIIELQPDYNNYMLHGMQQRSLEAAPLNEGGIVFVPITFFDQVWPLTIYVIGIDGSITFLTYMDPTI